MAAFFSFTQRNSYAADTCPKNDQEEPVDPWNLGVSTSTSTMETIGQQNSTDDVRLPKNPPSTPEGLRPRKSIQRIRRDVLESNRYAYETNFSYNLPPVGEAESRSQQRNHRELSGVLPPHRPHSSYDRPASRGIQIDGSPIRSASSFYEQSIEESKHYYDEDMDINSSMDESIYSRQTSSQHRLRAESPDLKRGSKPKTAVGAVLVAMAETTVEQKTANMGQHHFPREREYAGRHQHSILPPRSWMNEERFEDKYMANEQIDGDDTIDDNQSSLHASPSSLRRGVFPTYWPDREHQFQRDSSFTRRILNDDPSSSRLEERSIIGHSPYDFNPITQDERHTEPIKEPINAPRLLSLVENDNRVNISAISNSHRPREAESINTSLADTIEDDEEDYEEIPRYYHALADDGPARNIISDDAFIMRKVQNQRLDKEDLLRSTFERFQDCLDLLKDIYSPSSIENSFFLGLGKTKDGSEFYKYLQALLSELEKGASHGTQRQAIVFCLSILQNAASISNNDENFKSNFSSSFPSYRWVPRPGFRNALGLAEDPQSPQTIRGGDTSLFSLPSESANADTPHTSNVSLATTITTIVSPEKYRSRICDRYQEDSYRNSIDRIDIHMQNSRKTIESLARLLFRLEETCRGLKSKIRVKSMLIESIQNIYFELLNLSSADLKVIIESFDMEYSEPKSFTRTVSNDEEQMASCSPPHSRSSYQNKQKVVQDTTYAKESLRVNIVQSDNDDIDSDKRNQSIECDLWSPTTEDMMSLVSPQSEEENDHVTNEHGYKELKDNEPVDDLRRIVGSFDDGDVEDEREGPTSSEEREPDPRESFPATFARRNVARRSRKSRFWKKRFLALKNRGQQVTAE